MNFPQNKQFAFTIIDDTDNAEIENIAPVYDFLIKLGLKATKTVWALPPRDKFKGLALSDYKYRQFISKLQKNGFEIALHSVGSGRFGRQDILEGLGIFKKFVGEYPKSQINHAQNPDSIYWGIKRFSLLKPFWNLSHFQGENPNSKFFWGDYHLKHIKYTRNLVFSGINTLKCDPLMPYRDPQKPLANYWFSSSDGANVEKFNRLINPKNIAKLIEQKGVCIVYTHFASGFVLPSGRLNRVFQSNMENLARQNGYFANASDLLDVLLKNQHSRRISLSSKIKTELSWVWDKSKSFLP